MKKELRPFHDHVTCAVCGRTMLKGEHADAYNTTAGERHMVCDLCFARAERAGWVRESERGSIAPRSPHQPDRRSLFGRRRRRPESEEATPDPGRDYPEDAPVEADPAFAGGDAPSTPAPRPRRRREPPQDPRHVRAVPTTAEGRIERALELFNASDHQRTVAGLARSLGAPWVAAQPESAASSTVVVLVAWELSWYRFRVDLGDAAQAVTLLDKGDELDELGEDTPDWNAELDAEGRLVIGVASE